MMKLMPVSVEVEYLSYGPTKVVVEYEVAADYECSVPDSVLRIGHECYKLPDIPFRALPKWVDR